MVSQRSIRPQKVRLWAGFAAATLAVAVLAFVLVVRSSWSTHSRIASKYPTPVLPKGIWRVPAPGVLDVEKSYPLLYGGFGGGGGVNPTQTSLYPMPGNAYARRVRLAPAMLQDSPTYLPAYRLAEPLSSLQFAQLARRIGIRAGVTRVVDGELLPDRRPHVWTWLVAQQGHQPALNHGGPPVQPATYRSIAMSTATGQVIYHDLTAETRPAQRQLDRKHVIEAARSWLKKMGWPANRMVEKPYNRFELSAYLAVRFDFADVARTDWYGAILRVTPAGEVIEADLWPPTATARMIPVRPPADAYNRLRRAGGPLGMQMTVNTDQSNGTATVRRFQVIHVFTRAPDGKLYLVPAYRFEGQAHLERHLGTQTWLAIVSAARAGPALRITRTSSLILTARQIAADDQGHLYVLDHGNTPRGHIPAHITRLSSATGDPPVRWWTGRSFQSVRTLAADWSGNLYLLDGPDILELSTTGNVVKRIAWPRILPRGMKPTDFTVDYKDDMYLTGIDIQHKGRPFIAKLSRSPRGTLGQREDSPRVLTIWQNFEPRGTPSSGPSLPALAVDLDGSVYVSGYGRLIAPWKPIPYLYKLSPDGRLVATWKIDDPSPGQPITEVDVATDSIHSVYVIQNGQLRKFNGRGMLLMTYHKGATTRFYAVVVDAQDNVYCSANDGVYEYDPRGRLIARWT